MAVRSLACVFPARSVSNTEAPYTQIPNVPHEWWQFWGVQRRGMFDTAAGETHDRVAVRACREALRIAELEAADIDLVLANTSNLVVSTRAGQRFFPRLAPVIREELGARSALAMDVEQECLSFLIHLQNAVNLIRMGRCKRVLVCSVEHITDLLDYTDKSATIFGDAAAAAVVTADSDGASLLASSYVSRPEHYDLATLRWRNPRYKAKDEVVPDDFHTYFDLREDAADGMRKFVPVFVPEMVKQALERARLRADDVDYFVFHQPSPILIRGWANALGASRERYCTTLETRGSLVSASMPITLHHAIERGHVGPGKTIVIAGASTGWGFGAQVWRWGETRINVLG
ncbi:3-oxoacyl-ACP synthase III family protein [Pendulispora rubella]|uniref:3-oxoacyl-ACP synthase III family protein n=1 Tax=Pendulispora rubella TaxID=2741070 RepID=A0ABZ2LB08_9BACT